MMAKNTGVTVSCCVSVWCTLGHRAYSAGPSNHSTNQINQINQ